MQAIVKFPIAMPLAGLLVVIVALVLAAPSVLAQDTVQPPTEAASGGESGSAGARLAELDLHGVALEPRFNPDQADYEGYMYSREMESTTVTVTAEDADATVAISPADADADAAGHQVDLADGEDVSVEVTVTSSDGTSESVYTVAMNYGDGFVQVGVGHNTVCALRVDGTVDCWPNLPEPAGMYQHVSGGSRDSTDVVTACGLRTDGSIHCWRSRWNSRKGVRDTEWNKHTDTEVQSFSLWAYAPCYLKNDSTLRCRGHYTPDLNSEGESRPYKSVAVGYIIACVLTPDNLVKCLGWGGGSLKHPEPQTEFKYVEVGGYSVCGIRMDDTLLCWRFRFDDHSPGLPMVVIDTPEGEFKSVSTSYKASCAVKSDDGSIVCFKHEGAYDAHFHGHLVDAFVNNPPEGEFQSVSNGSLRACGLKTDGTLACWRYSRRDESTPSLVSPWADDARLLSLKVRDAAANDVALSPEFDRNTTDGYTAEVPWDTALVTVTPGATNRFAEVAISPADADPDTDGHQVALDVGTNSVSATVTSWDDSAELTYTLEIVRGNRIHRSVAENSAADTAVGLPVAHPDADPMAIYSLEGTDAASLRIDASTGQLYTVDGVDYDYETKASYSVTARVADGNGGSYVIVVAITLTDVPEPPSFDADTATRSLAELSPAGAALGEPFTAVDPEDDALAYSLEGADGAAFRIDAATGQLYTADGVDYDYEVKSTYAVIVRADDGNGGSDVIAVAITLTDVPEPPSFDADTAARSVAEFSPADTAVGEPVAATDPEGDALTYSLDGTDAASFRIDAATGQLYTVDGVDYDYAVKSTYAVVVRAAAGNGGSATVAVAITLSSPREVPYNMTAEGKDGAVLLTWEKPLGDDYVSDYRILRHRPELGEAEPLVYVAYTWTKDTTYTDEEVETGVLYVYRVQAVVNVFGDVGGVSQPVEIRLGDTSQQRADNIPATGLPVISGMAQVGEQLTADTSGIADEDGLTKAEFTYQWAADGVDIADATDSAYTLVDADEGKAISVAVSFTDDAGNEETLTSAVTDAVAPKPNTPATGLPTIIGTVQVGETLSVDTSGIADEEGLDNATYSYRWQADGADIAGATGSAYTLVEADAGKTISVTVSFTDDRGHAESLTSGTTAAVEAKPNSPATGLPTISGTVQVGETLTADTSSISDDDGLTHAVLSYQWRADGADIAGATNAAYTLTDVDEGKAISVTVSFTDDRGNAESLTSAATGAVAPKPNTPATGLPIISGTAQVGETLAADTSGIADADGLTNATFAYQWLADGSDIANATASSYTLVGADEDRTITVTVSFTDDRGNAESLTSVATEAVAGPPPEPLTASFSNAPSSHDGESVFTFDLHFSEEFSVSYKRLRDQAFIASGGDVTRAKRLERGSNIGWRIHVRPDGDGAVSIILPETTDCEATGAICTGDGRMLSTRSELTVGGP